MKNFSRLLIFTFFLLALLAFPSGALAKVLADDQVIVGQNYTLESGQTQDGTVLILGGNALIGEDATINGDLVIFGGNLTSNGTINGTVISLGSNANLGANAVISGDLVNLGGNLNRDPQAEISGQVITEVDIPLQLIPSIPREIPDFIPGVPDLPETPRVDLGYNFFVQTFMNVFWFLFRVFITAALAVLVVLIFPQPSVRTADAIARQPMLSFVAGMLTTVTAPIILVILTITILLIPVAFIGGVLLVAVAFFGWVSLGYFLGIRLMRMFRGNWAPAVAAGVGTFVLSFLAWSVSGLVPCVGWMLPWVLSFFGTGAVLITRVGTQRYRGPDLGSADDRALPPTVE
jgi:hypothetical protein